MITGQIATTRMLGTVLSPAGYILLTGGKGFGIFCIPNLALAISHAPY